MTFLKSEGDTLNYTFFDMSRKFWPETDFRVGKIDLNDESTIFALNSFT